MTNTVFKPQTNVKLVNNTPVDIRPVEKHFLAVLRGYDLPAELAELFKVRIAR